MPDPATGPATARVVDPADPAADPAVRRVVQAAARQGVTLAVRTFDVSTHTAAQAAEAVGAELGQIVKSLVFVVPGDGHESEAAEPVVCLVSGPNRVDVARLAATVGTPGIRRASADEARKLTGFPIGGIPPFGHDRPVRVVMDPDLRRFPEVWAAAGTPRAVFPIEPETLAALSGATTASIAQPAEGQAVGRPGARA